MFTEVSLPWDPDRKGIACISGHEATPTGPLHDAGSSTGVVGIVAAVVHGSTAPRVSAVDFKISRICSSFHKSTYTSGSQTMSVGHYNWLLEYLELRHEWGGAACSCPFLTGSISFRSVLHKHVVSLCGQQISLSSYLVLNSAPTADNWEILSITFYYIVLNIFCQKITVSEWLVPPSI